MNEKKIELWHVPSPGMELAEKLEEMGLDANDLAARMGYTPKAVNDILQANCRITPESAISLEMVTDIPAIYWLRRQMSYDEFVSRERIKASLSDQSLWKKSFPSEINVREWVRYDKGDEKSLIPLLKFFAVASPQAWDGYYKKAQLKVAFRISLAEVKDPYATSAWIRRGEILSDRDPMEKLGQIPVRKKLKAALPEIIAFAAANKTLPKRAKKITYTTPEADVVDDYVPLIQLHDRFEKRAAMWFTFFHELAHVLYHGKKGICLQNIEITHSHPEKEDEANCFAQKCMLEAGFEV